MAAYPRAYPLVLLAQDEAEAESAGTGMDAQRRASFGNQNARSWQTGEGGQGVGGFQSQIVLARVTHPRYDDPLVYTRVLSALQ